MLLKTSRFPYPVLSSVNYVASIVIGAWCLSHKDLKKPVSQSVDNGKMGLLREFPSALRCRSRLGNYLASGASQKSWQWTSCCVIVLSNHLLYRPRFNDNQTGSVVMGNSAYLRSRFYLMNTPHSFQTF